MREAASRGFWVASRVPYGFRKVHVQDGAKKRPTLEPDEDAARVVKSAFDMAEAARGMLYIARALTDEGIASPTGKVWSKNGVHLLRRNEAYTGALVWGTNAKDKAGPVRVEKAFPSIVSKAQFGRVKRLMRSRASKRTHPRCVGSTYLLSGLVKCKECDRTFSGQEAKGGQFSYYVCQSIMKRGKDACDSPRINARRFEEMIVAKVLDVVQCEGLWAWATTPTMPPYHIHAVADFGEPDRASHISKTVLSIVKFGGPGQSDSRKSPPEPCPPSLTIMPPPLTVSLHQASRS